MVTPEKGTPLGEENEKALHAVRKQFSQAGGFLKETEEALQREQLLLEASKDCVLSEIDTFFDKLNQIINRRRQLLKSEVNGVYDGLLEKIEVDTETLTLSLMCLGTLKKHTEDSIMNNHVSDLDKVVEQATEEINVQTEIVGNISVEKGFVEFYSPMDVVNDVKRKMRSLGRVKVNNFLPSKMVLKNYEAMVPLPSKVELAVTDFNGDAIDKSILDSNLLKFEIVAQSLESVEIEAEHNMGEQSVVLNFIPKCSGLHLLTMQMYGTVVNKVALNVDKAKPVVVVKGDFNNLNAVASGSDGSVYAVDSGSGKLLKYTQSGNHLWDYDFMKHENTKCFHVVFDHTSHVVVCTLGCSHGMDESHTEVCDKRKSALFEDLKIDLTEDLKMKTICYRDVDIVCIERQGYVALAKDNDIIISDPNMNVVTVYDQNGKFKQIISTEDFDCPGFVCARQNGTVLVSDIGNDVIRVSGPDGRLTLQVGSSGSDPVQLSVPVGLDTDDDGNVLVADNGNKRLQVFDMIGRCKAVIDSDVSKGAELNPWDLSVTNDGHVWVIDNRFTHTLQKYRYK